MNEVYKCQFNGTPRAFYCESTKTGEHKKLQLADPSMKGAQCLSPADYKIAEDYLQYVITQAEQRCH